MLIGVKDGKAVAARGNPDHPVNRGKLCPKGLSEHHILDAPGRATQPLLRKNGKLEPVSWDEALETMIERIRPDSAEARLWIARRCRHRPAADGRVLHLGKLVQLGFRTPNHRRQHHPLHGHRAVSGYKFSFGSDGPPGYYADMETADVILLIGANIADNHPILCQR